jgi:hypothetical protein
MKPQSKYTIKRMLNAAEIASTADGLQISGDTFKVIELTSCPDMLLFAAQRIQTLEEALIKAHEILLHEMDNGRTPTMLQGVGLGYFEDVIAGLDHPKQRD